MCIGRTSEFVALCKAMVETGIKPDFITVDGGDVTTEYYGDPDGSANGWSYQLVDTTQLITAGQVPRGEQAFYQFESGATTQDSSTSQLSFCARCASRHVS